MWGEGLLGGGLLEAWVFALAGFALLFVAGDLVVRGATCLARDIGVSELLVGLVVIAFGTSSPELVVSMRAVFAETPDIAVGNVIGSNIANILLVLGVGAMIHPIAMRHNVVWRDGVVMLAATIFLLWLSRQPGGTITQTAGLVLVGGLVLYILYSYFTERRKPEPSPGILNRGKLVQNRPGRLLRHSLYLLAGLAGLLLGANALLYGAEFIARDAGVSEATIGVTLVAFGTSVPELAAVSIAAMRGHPQLALGSVVGSNIFNILAVLGITALFHPIAIAREFGVYDLFVVLGVAVVFLAFLIEGRKLNRIEGAIMFLAYLVYIGLFFAGIRPEILPL